MAKELNGEEVPFDFFSRSKVSSSQSNTNANANTNRDVEAGKNKDDRI